MEQFKPFVYDLIKYYRKLGRTLTHRSDLKGDTFGLFLNDVLAKFPKDWVGNLQKRNWEMINKIFVVGLPRSGTTYLRKLMEIAYPDQIVRKVSEDENLHPINSDRLYKIDDPKTIFVFINREEEGVYQSFHAARTAEEMELEEINPTSDPDLTGIASITDEQIKEMIDNYRANLEGQKFTNMVSVQYEMLGNRGYFQAFINQLRNIEVTSSKVDRWHWQQWGKSPVRAGALSFGLRKMTGK